MLWSAVFSSLPVLLRGSAQIPKQEMLCSGRFLLSGLALLLKHCIYEADINQPHKDHGSPLSRFCSFKLGDRAFLLYHSRKPSPPHWVADPTPSSPHLPIHSASDTILSICTRRNWEIYCFPLLLPIRLIWKQEQKRGRKKTPNQ